MKLLTEHFDALEVDFRREYQLDLAQSCWGTNPLDGRKLIGLIRHLPADSATARSLNLQPPPVVAPMAALVAPERKKANPAQIRAFFASGNN